jgi:hypothetical protein
LLVTKQGLNRHASKGQSCLDDPEISSAWPEFRESLLGQANFSAGVIEPLPPFQIHEQGAAGIAHVGGMDCAATELP